MNKHNSNKTYHVNDQIQWTGAKSLVRTGKVLQVIPPGSAPKGYANEKFKVETYFVRDQSRHLIWLSPDMVVYNAPLLKRAAILTKQNIAEKKTVIVAKQPKAKVVQATVKPTTPVKAAKPKAVAPVKVAPVKFVTPKVAVPVKVTPAKELTPAIKVVKPVLTPESIKDRNSTKSILDLIANTTPYSGKGGASPLPDIFKREFPSLRNI